MDEESKKKLDAFEKMLSSLLRQYEDTSAQLQQLKEEGREKTATFKQLMGNKLMLGNFLSVYRRYGLGKRNMSGGKV